MRFNIQSNVSEISKKMEKCCELKEVDQKCIGLCIDVKDLSRIPTIANSRAGRSLCGKFTNIIKECAQSGILFGQLKKFIY